MLHLLSVKKSYQIVIILLLLLIFSFVGLYFYINFLFQAVTKEAKSTSVFIIPKGQAIKTIASRLEKDGFIKKDLAFILTVKLAKLENEIQAGSFEISPSMTVKEIASEFTKGTNDIWITIPEGWRREEIADYLASEDLPAFNKVEFLSLTEDLEGRLFPDTYLVPKTIDSQGLVNIFAQTFEKKVIKDLASEIEKTSLSLDETITLASLVQRESRGFEEMKEVAAVLYNRLKINMALQVDASLQYVKGFDNESKSWWASPLAEDKEFDSPFNTYKYPGLPPKAICNPGLDALKAVLSPGENNYLYYLHDHQGTIHFATDLAGHNQNIKKYLQ